MPHELSYLLHTIDWEGHAVHAHFSIFLIEIADKNLGIAVSLSHPAPFFKCWPLAHEDPCHAQLFQGDAKEKSGMEHPGFSSSES